MGEGALHSAPANEAQGFTSAANCGRKQQPQSKTLAVRHANMEKGADSYVVLCDAHSVGKRCAEETRGVHKGLSSRS